VRRQTDAHEVVEQERAGIDRRTEEARQSGDPRRREIVENLAAERGLELDLLPDDLAGKVQSLQHYDFMDDAARARFEELMDQLRDQLLQSYFNQMSEGMQNMSPEQMARMKDMLSELNQMLDQRERGEEPDFDGFMERYGDFFPGNPQSLDELLEQMAQSMAAKNLPALASEQAPSFGPASAKVHLVEFFDPACETCAAFFPHVKKLMAAHPDRIRLSLRHVPFHPGSEVAVRALEASRQQGKYLQVLEGLYARQDSWVIQHQVQADRVWAVLGGLGLDMDKLRADMNAPEVGQRLARDMDDARLLGVTKTPEFFANGRPMPSFGLEQLQTLVGEELRRAYP